MTEKMTKEKLLSQLDQLEKVGGKDGLMAANNLFAELQMLDGGMTVISEVTQEVLFDLNSRLEKYV